MIKGLVTNPKKFLKNLRKSKTYKKLLKDKGTQKVVSEVNDYLNSSGIDSNMVSQVKSLMSYIVDGSASVKIIAVGAILYFLAPLDLIPDIIPGMGFADDAIVIGAAIEQIKAALT